jgi:hypothetical protein
MSYEGEIIFVSLILRMQPKFSFVKLREFSVLTVEIIIVMEQMIML